MAGTHDLWAFLAASFLLWLTPSLPFLFLGLGLNLLRARPQPT